MGDTPMSFVCPVARKTQRFDIDGYIESGRRGVRDFYFGMPHGGWRVTWDRDNAQRIVKKFA